MKIATRHLSIRAKLALILGVTIFALAATRALGLVQLGGFLDRFMSYTTSLEKTQDAMSAVQAAERGLAREWVILHAAARQSGGEIGQQLASAADGTDQALVRLERLAPEVGLDAARVRALREAHRSTRAGYGAGAVAAAALEHPQQASLQEIGERLAARFARQRETAAGAYATETRIMNGTYISMLGLVLGAGIVAYVLIAKMVTRPLARMVEVANTVAAGDLRSTIEITSEDELGQVMRALRDMNSGLARLIGEVRQGSVAIAAGSGQIDSANASLADRMADQAAALEETATTMEQLTTTVGRNAEQARRAAESAGHASGIAEKGGAEVSRVVDTMNAIDAGARRITDIIGVIDSIAFQTNILALNAAVEAARAGEQGRGFAVVATEVRSLAQKSAAAAREIKTLIEDALTRVDEGSQVVQAAGRTMAEVVAAAQEVTGIVTDIATLSAEQAHGLQEINRAVADMDQKTRNNSELVDHAADAARANREQAAALEEAIAVFRLAETGHEPAHRHAPAPRAQVALPPKGLLTA